MRLGGGVAGVLFGWGIGCGSRFVCGIRTVGSWRLDLDMGVDVAAVVERKASGGETST